MSFNRYFTFIALLTTGAAQAPNLIQQKTFIFAWCTVFEPSESGIERRVKKRLGLFRSIGLLFKGIPEKEEIKNQLFSLLNEIKLTPAPVNPKIWRTSYPSWEIDYKIPPIFSQYLVTNTIEGEQKIYQKISDYLNQADVKSKSTRRILHGVADFIFQSEHMNTAMEPITEMLDFIDELKSKKHKVILVGNIPGYAWDSFLTDFKQAQVIKKLFPPENIFISGKEQALKTSEQMYKKIMSRHKINPKQTFVVDCNANNLTYAKKMGIRGFVFKPQENLVKTLRGELL